MNVVDKQSFSVNSLCNECSYERAFIFIETSQESSIIAPIAVVTLQGLNEMAVIVVMIQTGFVSFVFLQTFLRLLQDLRWLKRQRNTKLFEPFV